jgi:hypothetical protein
MKFFQDIINFCNICIKVGTGDVHKVTPIGCKFYKNWINEEPYFA